MSVTIEYNTCQWYSDFLTFADTVKALQEHGILVLFFQTPLIANIRGLTEFETNRVRNWEFDFNNISEDDYRKIAQIYNNEVTLAYLNQVYDGVKVYTRNGIKYLADFRSELVNITNGERYTVGQPAAYQRSIHIYGQCTARGTGVEDKNTIPSFLQAIFNKQISDQHIIVRNKAIGCGSGIRDDVAHVKRDLLHQGDVVIFCTDMRNVSPALFREKGIPYYDCSPLFNRPHNYGEWFTDTTFHTLPVGNKVIAEYIYQSLQENREFFTHLGENKETVVISCEEYEVDEIKIRAYLDSLNRYRRDGLKCGAIIMNCNPLTEGHLYLIETAASRVEWLYIFVVEENKSFFDFKDRIDLVRRGTEHIGNLSVLPSGKYVLSADTFPGYFYKENKTDIVVDASMDIHIFGKYIASALNIGVRFVGEEPLDPVTATYNRQMHEILPLYGIEVEEIERKEYGGAPISASRVRKLLKEHSFGTIKSIVPEVTYKFLEDKYG